MRIWPLNVIDRQIAAQVDARVAEQAAAIRREAEQTATRRAAEALATALQGNEMPQGPRPAMYAFDNPFIYSQPHSPRMRPRTKIDLETLRRLADTYDVMRSCINHLKTEVQAVPIKLVAKDARDDSAGIKKSIEEATAWLDSRAGGLGGFGLVRRHFEDQIFEDALVLGAFAVFVQQARNGKPYQVVAIDSATIKPKVDPYGWQHPGDAYEQWVQGVNVRPSISMDELIYDGMYPVSSTPYYRSPVEWLAGVTISALKADEWNRTWLTDGNTPDQLIAVPKEWSPTQLQEYAAYFDAMLAGQMPDRRKARLVPDGTKPVWTQTRKDSDFQQFELWLMRRTCSIFGVQPASIGYAGEQYKVSQEESFSATSQFGVGRLLAMRADLYNDLLERLGFDGLQLVNVTEGEEEPGERTDRLAKAVGGPWMTPNEARKAEGLEPIEGGDDLVGSVQPDEFDDSEGDMPEDDDPEEDEQRAADLRRWERKALSRLREFGSPVCEFSSEWLDELDRVEIAEALLGCSSAEDVREVFERYSPSQPRDARGRFMPTYKVAKLGASLHKSYGGSTVNYIHGNMAGKPFFAVSTHLERQLKLDNTRDVSAKQIREFAQRNLALLKTGKYSIGTWYNPDDGATYIDVVSTVSSRDRAEHLAKAHNQIAIWDLGGMKEIKTGGTGSL